MAGEKLVPVAISQLGLRVEAGPVAFEEVVAGVNVDGVGVRQVKGENHGPATRPENPRKFLEKQRVAVALKMFQGAVQGHSIHTGIRQGQLMRPAADLVSAQAFGVNEVLAVGGGTKKPGHNVGKRRGAGSNIDEHRAGSQGEKLRRNVVFEGFFGKILKRIQAAAVVSRRVIRRLQPGFVARRVDCELPHRHAHSLKLPPHHLVQQRICQMLIRNVANSHRLPLKFALKQQAPPGGLVEQIMHPMIDRTY